MPGKDIRAPKTLISTFNQYNTLVESFPVFDADEERSLVERMHTDQDTQAHWLLISSHLRYVVYIARSYKGYGLSQEDLIQEGSMGLLEAVQRFDPTRGVRLVAYASYWIRAYIHDFILKNWRIVKVATTKAKRKLFYKLRGAKKRLQWLSRDEADDIAEALNVTADDVIDMEGRLYQPDESLDFSVGLSGDDHWVPATYLEDYRFEPASAVADAEFFDIASGALEKALTNLDSRSRDIITSRWLAEEEDKSTLQELADRYQVSAERIRQIETTAIKRLRSVMIPQLGASDPALTAVDHTIDGALLL